MNDDWVETTLGAVAEIVGGGTPSTSEPSYWGEDVVWLTPTEVVKADGTRIGSSGRMISASGLANSSAKMLPRNTVLLTTRASVGFVALADCALATNQGFQSLIPGPSVTPEFLMYWVQGNRTEFTSRAGGSTFPEIGKSKVHTIPISLPPLPVQRRIVDLMAHLDNQIANLRAERLAASTVMEALTTELLFGDQSENWPLVTLGDAFDVRDGTHESPKYVDVGFPLLTSKNLSSGRLSRDGSKLISPEDYDAINIRSGVAKGDLLMAMIGTIGNVCLVESEPDFAVKNVAIFKSRTQASRRLLYYQLKSREMNETMANEAKGSTQRFVSLGYLRNLEVPTPSLAIARELVRLLDSAESLILSLEEEMVAAELMRNCLLSSILTRQVVLPPEQSLDVDEVA